MGSTRLSNPLLSFPALGLLHPRRYGLCCLHNGLDLAEHLADLFLSWTLGYWLHPLRGCRASHPGLLWCYQSTYHTLRGLGPWVHVVELVIPDGPLSLDFRDLVLLLVAEASLLEQLRLHMCGLGDHGVQGLGSKRLELHLAQLGPQSVP